MVKHKVNNRVRIKGGDYTMETSFRSVESRTVSDIQTMYRKRWYTQQQLADMFGYSIGLINKMCRCDPKAPRQKWERP